jgi:hypothetical protein
LRQLRSEILIERLAPELAAGHDRLHLVSPEVADVHAGHGNVMPQSLHGGPGRAGAGEQFGGLRVLNFYYRRAAIQVESGRRPVGWLEGMRKVGEGTFGPGF